MWIIYALLSAVFAALTTILAKIGVENVDSTLATAIRTAVVLVMAWGMVFLLGKQGGVSAIGAKSWVFLTLSGLATGGSWLFIALLSGMNPLYEISFWWIAALIVLSFIGLLIGKCMNHPLQEASLRQSAYTIFLLYLSYAIAQLGMIAVLHPVSVDEIIRTGEAAGGASGEYVGRLTSDTAEHPLGVYFFTSADKSQWYYYDVLTGEAADDYHSSYEPA